MRYRVLLVACLSVALAQTQAAFFPPSTYKQVVSALPSGVSLAAIDGETLTNCPTAIITCNNTLNYFSRSGGYNASPNAASAFLDGKITNGGWEEQPESSTELGYAVAIGETQYVNMAGYPSSAQTPAQIAAAGMHILSPSNTSGTGSETVGWLGSDEVDLNQGPGSGAAVLAAGTSGNWNQVTSCTGNCGYTVMQFLYTGAATGGSGTIAYPIDARVVNIGAGKGVLQFECCSTSTPWPFLQYSDINSADEYWTNDDAAVADTSAACQVLGAASPLCTSGGMTFANTAIPVNYEANVYRLRAIQQANSVSKPIWVDVDTACPYSGGTSYTASMSGTTMTVTATTGYLHIGDQVTNGTNTNYGYITSVPAGNQTGSYGISASNTVASTTLKSWHCNTPAQFTAAAWHAFVAGARGIIWFQHNFSVQGPCASFGGSTDYRTFIDGSNASSPEHNCPYISDGISTFTYAQAVAQVTAFNCITSSIKPSGGCASTDLSSVLLTPIAGGTASTVGGGGYVTAISGNASYIVHWSAAQGAFYIIAGSGTPGSAPSANQSVTFTLADKTNGKTVTVVNESRTLTLNISGQFTDTFADANAVHVYKIDWPGA